MKIFGYQLGKAKPRTNTQPEFRPEQAMPSQTRDAMDIPYASTFSSMDPTLHNLQLYEVLRSSIPILDIAIIKMNLLIGDFKIVTGEEKLDADLAVWKQNVRIHNIGKGLQNCIWNASDSTFETGTGFVEIIPTRSLSGIYSLKNCNSRDFGFFQGDTGEIQIGTTDSKNVMPKPLAHPEFVYYLAYDKRKGHPQGYSLFYSLPYVGQVFLRAIKALDNQLWRLADPMWTTITKSGDAMNFQDAIKAKDNLKAAFDTAMSAKRQGKAQDIHGVAPPGGDITFKSLTPDGVYDLNMPFTKIVEFIVARLHLAPFMLGLHWSTSERMSSEQHDLLLSTIYSYRTMLEGLIRFIVDRHLVLTNQAGIAYQIKWEDISLFDETETAKADLLMAQARKAKVETYLQLLAGGVIDVAQFVEWLIIESIIPEELASRISPEEIALNMVTQLKRWQAGKIAKAFYPELEREAKKWTRRRSQ